MIKTTKEKIKVDKYKVRLKKGSSKINRFYIQHEHLLSIAVVVAVPMTKMLFSMPHQEIVHKQKKNKKKKKEKNTKKMVDIPKHQILGPSNNYSRVSVHFVC